MSEPSVPPPPPAAANNNKTLMLVLAYLGLLALVPLLTEKDDKEVQWHAKHGLVQFFAWIIVFVLFSILSFIPGVGCVTSIISLFLWIPYLIVTILSIMKAVNGQRFLIPGLSDFADKF
ncbi:MAG: DUF4870 domain-containing protein [Thermoanaerobaculia bacterium]|jgi:uncharacterized membrane protein|nr:DUF4870 domain-containing protein [Thermoanaerobaculia bacterium]MBP9824819.1 DUF4870 domain-containing protein [Thermoanaerobaculia bacterium]